LGVDASGNALGNPFDGISVDADSSEITIGGSASGQGNVIADNGGAGIHIAGSSVSVIGNTLYDNTDGGVLIDGGSKVTITGNGGVLIDGGSNVTITTNTIGNGLVLTGATDVTIQGNYLGVDQSGAALGNWQDGLFIDADSSGITVGGSGFGEGNTIADNFGA